MSSCVTIKIIMKFLSKLETVYNEIFYQFDWWKPTWVPRCSRTSAWTCLQSRWVQKTSYLPAQRWLCLGRWVARESATFIDSFIWLLFPFSQPSQFQIRAWSLFSRSRLWPSRQLSVPVWMDRLPPVSAAPLLRPQRPLLLLEWRRTSI